MIGYQNSPTKANLIRFKEDLKLAQDGYELLDRKREVLLRELMHFIYEVKQIQDTILEKLPLIYQVFKKAEIKLGREKIASILSSKKIGREIHLLEKSVMGIHIPEVYLEEKLKPGYYSPLHTPAELDQTLNMLVDFFPALLHYLELKYAVVRIASEVKRTERRLRSLENIFIPEYKSAILGIETYLEENEREEFFRTKKVKSKLAGENV